jgi:hypothetical protein
MTSYASTCSLLYFRNCPNHTTHPSFVCNIPKKMEGFRK